MTLVRSVRCDSPMRPGEPCDAIVAYHALRSFVSRAMPITIVGAVVASFLLGPKTQKCWGESKGDIASATVKKYAYEAYPSWQQQHPDRTCPDSLLELNEYMNNKDTLDPWGTSYSFLCDGHGFVVRSAGDDRRFGTTDDLTSH